MHFTLQENFRKQKNNLLRIISNQLNAAEKFSLQFCLAFDSTYNMYLHNVYKH